MSYFELLISFIVGISLGSFLNVLTYRIPLGKSLFFPSSSCPNCNYKIKFYENVPVLGWLFLKGKCSNCKTNISAEYFFVELIFGCFSVFYYFNIEGLLNINTISGYFMFYFLFALSIIDFKIKEVPISLLILSFLSAVLYIGQKEALFSGLFVIGAFYIFKLIYEYIRGIEILGEGDLPILGIYGVLLGISKEFFDALLCSAIIGLIFVLIVYVKRKEVIIPFIPSLTISLLIFNFYYIDNIKKYILISF